MDDKVPQDLDKAPVQPPSSSASGAGRRSTSSPLPTPFPDSPTKRMPGCSGIGEGVGRSKSPPKRLG